jgi:hypothetical protein
MNESDFENELRKLRPALPSRKLADGIAQELASISRAADLRTDTRSVAYVGREEVRVPWLMRWLDRLLWLGLGATAVLALMVSQQAPKPAIAQSSQASSRVSAPQDSSLLQPVLASEEDLGWRDEGVRFDSQGQPMLKLTRTAVKREAWADLKNAGVVQMETPRQEVMWVPVALH